MCFCLNLVNTLNMGKVISSLYRNTLSPVASVVQRERKDTSVLQLCLLSGSRSIARSHHLIASFKTGSLLFLEVQSVSDGSVGHWGQAVCCCAEGRAQGWRGTREIGKWTCLSHGVSLA